MQLLSRALGVLECVVLSQPIGVSEVARRLDLPKSSAHRLLLALEEEGWLAREKVQSGLWVQSPRFWGLVYRGKEVGPRLLAQEPMRRLWLQTNENIHFTQQQGDHLVVLDKIESTRQVRVFDPIGMRIPLHVSASGKALLATRDPKSLESYLQRSLTRFTEQSLADGETLRQQVAEVRTEGYAVNRGEWRSEIAGVGIALNVNDHQASDFGMAISAPTHRITEELIAHYSQLLLSAKDQVAHSAGLTTDGTHTRKNFRDGSV